MRYDKNFACFKPHTNWYTFVIGKGYVPTDEAPPDAIKAMQEYNSYTFNNCQQTITESELRYLEYISEYRKTHPNLPSGFQFSKPCPLCSGKVYYYRFGNSYMYQCEEKDCFIEQVRVL